MLTDGRGGQPPQRFEPDGRYHPNDLIHTARRPEPDSAKRYPPAPLVPPTTINKYPSTSNKFPVGTDRYPIDIYKYGNRYGSSGSSSSARPGEPKANNKRTNQLERHLCY